MQSPAQPRHADWPVPLSHRPLRVILADDVRPARQALARFLRSLKHIDLFAECENGSIAVDRALATPPDLVVLDVQMPVMDGQDAARLIRAAAPRVCIIMTSLNEDPDTQLACFAAGADAFIGKRDFNERFAAALAHARASVANRCGLQLKVTGDAERPAPLATTEPAISPA